MDGLMKLGKPSAVVMEEFWKDEVWDGPGRVSSVMQPDAAENRPLLSLAACCVANLVRLELGLIVQRAFGDTDAEESTPFKNPIEFC